MKQLFKTILKYRLSSVLTLVSLVVAFLGIIVLSLYVSYERSFDGFHKNKKDIYLMSFKIEDRGSSLPVPMGELIGNEVPEIERNVIMCEWWNNEFYRTDQTLKDAIRKKALHASADFFTMFDFPLIAGDAKTVLSSPNSVVLSETLARNIFGTVDVVGKQLLASGNELTVTGVMKDMPKNTSFSSDAIVSLITKDDTDWSEWSFSIFLQLKNGADKAVVERKITDIERIAETSKQIAERYSPEAAAVDLLPLSKIHYGSRGYFSSVNKTVLGVLSLLIVVLLVMGAVNFINFSTSQAPSRAKSLSVQQILGAVKWKARLQITGEAVALSLIALGVALVIHNLMFQRLENLFQITGLSLRGREPFYAAFVLLAVIFGVIAASYPSRYITSPPISQAVKGKMFFSGKGKTFRSVLITVQFVFTIALIAASLTIEKQLRFWNNFDIGIDKENVLYLRTSNVLRKSHQAFADELMKNADITNYCYTQFLPGRVGMGWGLEVDGQQIQLQAWPIDDRFIDFFGIKMAEGRTFRQGEADINNFILNEKAVQQFGWDNAPERKIPGFDFTGDIVGVAQNFNFESLKGEIRPMLFWRTDTRKNNILIKTRGGNFTQIRKYIEDTASRFDPDGTFEARFLDEALEQQYSKETRMARFIEFVSLWTILLALTGLLGLIVFISRDKVKEIGIRKVNGATIFEVVRMLNKNVLIWLGIAFLIATPITYYAMSRWLENFAYKTALSWWIFALAGLASLIVALLTVSWQSWRAAGRNPVEALRYE